MDSILVKIYDRSDGIVTTNNSKLFIDTYNGNINQVLERLPSVDISEINHINSAGMTVLHLLCILVFEDPEFYNVIQQLLKYGANQNIVFNTEKYYVAGRHFTPLCLVLSKTADKKTSERIELCNKICDLFIAYPTTKIVTSMIFTIALNDLGEQLFERMLNCKQYDRNTSSILTQLCACSSDEKIIKYINIVLMNKRISFNNTSQSDPEMIPIFNGMFNSYNTYRRCTNCYYHPEGRSCDNITKLLLDHPNYTLRQSIIKKLNEKLMKQDNHYSQKSIELVITSDKLCHIRDIDGNTFLHYALKTGGNMKYIMIMLESGKYDLTIMNNDGNDIIHLICLYGNNEMLKKCMHMKNLNSKNNEGNTYLHLLCDKSHLTEYNEMFMTLLSTNRCDYGILNNYGESILHRCYNYEVVMHILNTYKDVGNIINRLSFNHQTPLMSIVEYDAISEVEDEDEWIQLIKDCDDSDEDVVINFVKKYAINKLNKAKYNKLIQLYAEDSRVNIDNTVLSIANYRARKIIKLYRKSQ